MEKQNLKVSGVQELEISTLTLPEWNPRKINEDGFIQLKKIIERDPMMLFAKPIIVSERDVFKTVVAGNQRVRAAQSLGRTTIPCVIVTGMDYETEQRWSIKDNRHSGDWDWSVMVNIDEKIILEAGFTKVEINERFKIDTETQEDKFNADVAREAIENPITQLGDLYEIGSHRILCGDSTKPEDMARLMDGRKANCIFTDPPYNVDYNYAKYDAIHYNSRARKFKDGGKIFNDNKTPAEFHEWLTKMFKNCYEHTTDDCPIYVCHATKSQSEFFAAFKDAGWHFSQTIIWLKERLILAMGQDFHRVYEPIMYGWKDGKKHYSNHYITNQTEVWDLDKLEFAERLDVWYNARDKSADYDHPTQKPIALPGRAIRKSCPPDGLCLEPFMGSGSSMIAAHQLGRTCYGVELDPAYVDVEIRRMLKYAPELTLKRNGVEIVDKGAFMPSDEKNSA